MSQQIPIQTQHLFSILDNKLMELLHSLTAEEWEAQTIARLWKVKDVAAHLLDGNIRALSIQKEKYFGEAPPAIESYDDLVSWLNQLNADWVKAAKRISPSVLGLLHEPPPNKPAITLLLLTRLTRLYLLYHGLVKRRV